MNISNHILTDAKQRIIPGGRVMPIRRAAVIHFTSGATAESSIEFWKSPACRKDDIGAHVIIDRDGTIYQCRAFNRTISHAGTSRWRDPRNGTIHRLCNGFTIGIELANAGDDEKVQRVAVKLKGYAGIKGAIHPLESKIKSWEVYPAKQLKACSELCAALCALYRLDDITGHENIAPERKNDPGPLFPMRELREYCGFTGLPATLKA